MTIPVPTGTVTTGKEKTMERATRDFLVQLGLALATVVVVSLPTLATLAFWKVSGAEGFWQMLALGGCAAAFLGTFQVLLFVAGCAFMFIVWAD